MVKIPIVTPNKDKNVLIGFAIIALKAKKRLSKINLNNNFIY